MRRIKESRGLAFGPDSLHAVDIIPLPNVEVPSWDDLWQDLREGLMWKDLTAKELFVLKRLFPGQRLKGWLAVGRRVFYRIILPADKSLIEGLYTVESGEESAPAEARHLLAGIMGSFFVSRLAAKNHRTPDAGLLAGIQMARLMNLDGPVELPNRLNRKTLETMAEDFLKGLSRMPHVVVSPLGGVDKVRYWLTVGRRMWMPEVLQNITPHYTEIADQIQFMLWYAGQAHALTASHLSYKGVSLPRREDLVPNYLVQAHLWAVGGADKDVVVWTLERPLEIWLRWDEWFLPEREQQRAREVAELLLKDAQQHRVYVPRGVYVLRLPAGIPLYRWGARTLRIRVDEKGMWVQPVDEEGRGSTAVRWEPQVGILGRSLVAGADALHVTLAALWRDMVTGGETALPREGKGGGRVGGKKGRSEKRGREHPQRLPRRRLQSFVLSGTRTWGGEEERERIERRAHMVAGHIRRLPPGYSASEEARQAAQRAGIFLPTGTTWVRPHVRGGSGKGDVHTERPLVCIGLMQLIAQFKEGD